MKFLTPLLLIFGLVLATPASAQVPAPKTETKDGVQHVDAKDAAKLLATKDEKKKPVVLDIRTPGEFKGGHLAGAKNIDFNDKDFAENIAKLDKEKPYVVY
jgi:3-mercaptopyruvate sulfurtransferase SseA